MSFQDKPNILNKKAPKSRTGLSDFSQRFSGKVSSCDRSA